jgi:hypothetical protein
VAIVTRNGSRRDTRIMQERRIFLASVSPRSVPLEERRSLLLVLGTCSNGKHTRQRSTRPRLEERLWQRKRSPRGSAPGCSACLCKIHTSCVTESCSCEKSINFTAWKLKVFLSNPTVPFYKPFQNVSPVCSGGQATTLPSDPVEPASMPLRPGAGVCWGGAHLGSATAADNRKPRLQPQIHTIGTACLF